MISSLVLAVAYASTSPLWGDTNEALSVKSLPTASLTLPEKAATPLQQPPVRLSHSTTEVVRLTQSGVDEGVVLSFVESSGTFHLTADQIVYLSDLGAPARVIQAMLARDRENLARLGRSTNATQNPLSVREEPMGSPVEKSLETELINKSSPVTAPAIQAMAVATDAPAAQNLNTSEIPQASAAETEMLKQKLRALEKLSRPQNAPTKQKVFYPVREPYAVELTAPIVFLDPPTF